MKHKAKSFIAVLLALCLMMSLGVGALAVDGSDGFDTHGGEAIGPNTDIPSSDDDLTKPENPEPELPGPPEPRVGEEYTLAIQKPMSNGTVEVQGKALDNNQQVKVGKDEEITLIVKPDEGFKLEKLQLMYMKDNSPTYEELEAPYTFKLPSDTVFVLATFVEDTAGEETKYEVKFNTEGEGTVTADPKWAAKGDTVTLTVTPDEGYVVSSLNVLKQSDMQRVTTTKVDETTYTFKMPDGAVSVRTTFKEIQASDPEYQIKTSETHGTVTVLSALDPGAIPPVVPNPTTAKAESTIFFSVTPDSDDYELAELKVTPDEGEVIPFDTETPPTGGQYSFTMPASDVTISAVFQEKAVTPETPSITVNRNPEAGGTVTVKVNGEEQAGDTFTAEEGDTVTFTVTPAAGYERGTVAVTGITNLGHDPNDASKFSFTMPAWNVTITVNFKAEVQYNITVDDDIANGRVTASADRAAAGTTVKLTAEPDTGYVLDKYIVTMDSGVHVYFTGDTFIMPSDNVTVTATFKLKQDQPDWSHWHKIDTWSNSIDGGISVGDDADMALAGSTVTFRVWHNYRYDYYDYDVYVLNDRTGNRVSLDYSAYYDEYSFTMPEDDVTIYVYFDYAGRYSITKDVEGDGSIYVRSSADHGDTVWIEATPSAGQSLTSLRVFYGEPWAYGDKGYYGYWDEAEVKYSTYWDAYYFTMPADDVVVYARFTDGATVDVIAGDHGDAKVSSRYADKGDWVYITAYPDEGYEVDSVTVTDSLGRSVKVTELSYDYFLFTMPGTSVDVKVTFRAKDYDVFYDVSRGDWYYKAVRFVHEKGIMEGTGTHYFSPEADLSRGMLATILYRLEGSPSVSGYSGFADVADTAYYAKAVAWAKANGIVNGVTATAYEPDTAVTREELAAILCRYAAFKGKDTAISYDYLAGFSDANTSHVYARPALNWAVAYDIINGQGNGVLAPRATATRAEVAQVLMNYLEVFD